MKVAVFGAGAIGGYIGARLAVIGEDVTLVARGPHLAALQKDGLRLIDKGQETVLRLNSVGSGAEAGPQDYVILAVKAHSVTPALDSITPLLGPETAVVTAQNGFPWWYFHGVEGPLAGRRLESVDPGGRIWETIGPERAIGCVVYTACEVIAPGVIEHGENDRFSLGEPDGSRSERASWLSKAMMSAGMKAPLRTNIRGEIWLKLWGNVPLNPISALTHATLAGICRQPAVRAYAREIMVEVEAVATALGEKMALDVDARLDGAAAVGEHKTSMLQDFEHGRPMEIEAITGAVVELARMGDIATPSLDTLDGMIRLLAQQQS